MNTIRYAVVAMVAALGLGVPAQEADAALLFASNGAGICRAVNGVDTNSFTFGAAAVRNISPTAKLLSCNLPLLRESRAVFPLLPTGYQLNLFFGSSSATTQTVTCTALVAYAGQVAGTRSQSTKSVVLAPAGSAGASGRISFSRTDLAIKDLYAPLNLTCSLPSGVVFGRVDQFQPELAQVGL